MAFRDFLSLHFLVGIMSSNNVSFTVYKNRANCDCISGIPKRVDSLLMHMIFNTLPSGHEEAHDCSPMRC